MCCTTVNQLKNQRRDVAWLKKGNAKRCIVHHNSFVVTLIFTYDLDLYKHHPQTWSITMPSMMKIC